jgi:hypothetical protein
VEFIQPAQTKFLDGYLHKLNSFDLRNGKKIILSTSVDMYLEENENFGILNNGKRNINSILIEKSDMKEI